MFVSNSPDATMPSDLRICLILDRFKSRYLSINRSDILNLVQRISGVQDLSWTSARPK